MRIATPAEASGLDRFLGDASSGRWAGQQFDMYGLRPASLRIGDTALRSVPRAWQFFLDTVVEEIALRIGLVDDLLAAGLGFDVPMAMGKTELVFEKVGDMQGAEVSMDGMARSRNDALGFTDGKVPNPIIHKDFFLTRRQIDAAGTSPESLPTTQLRVATRKVLEKRDDLALNGGGPVVDGNQAYGILNHPDRIIQTYSAGAWSDPSVTGPDIVKDLNAAMQASRDNGHYGPWNLYIPNTYQGRLTEDYAQNYPKSIRARLAELQEDDGNSIRTIRVLDQMPAGEAALVELRPETVQVGDGEPPQPIQWDIHGGMGVNFKVFAIQTVVVKSQVSKKTGIVHLVAGS